jgi:hypothetical protein
MIIRNVIKAVLLAAILISLHFFLRRDYHTIAFCFVILLVIFVEFFFPKKWGGK